ncbi:long-chain fatty acid transporter FadL [Limnobaculum zhutongyuii]|uniref:Long-chain fatty acid transport protein n=1 Tax=Limnobaculum zhutongyuii TaxID=2498113 RepID=A0A411WL89_9GAMM|nr:long-chain fatty acid transporter FadL [Limnobaculum zhutongyuii]QBH97001.1 long-chain fatty acid transporter FadL [Limnobaculum zhutongyuii]TQS87449.1 long-chain fatty acid transporter FadL [Limnobaculum zhutongyuii]
MHHKNILRKSALAIVIAAVSSNLYASGFQLQESSASGLGRAFSGEGAIADNAASGSRNPASMTMFDRPTFSGGAIYVQPTVKIDGTSPSGSDMSVSDITPNEWVPNLHFIYPINDSWAVGGSLTSNYGLSTQFSDDYAAGPLAGKTSLKTGNLNFSAAYRINEYFSFGAGFNAIYAEAEINRHAGENSNGMPRDTEVVHMKGDEWGYGWNAGLLYEIDKENRIGLSYRSQVDIDFSGDYSSELPSKYNAMQAATGMPWGTNGQTVNGDLTLSLPEVWELAGYHKVAPKWAMHYGLSYTSWSEFKELKGTGSEGQTLFYKKENFRDAYRIALGTTYYHDDTWTWRAGIAFDDSAVPADTRSISIPDQDRLWLSLGSTYNFTKDASVDLGVSYMHGQKVKIEEKLNNSANSPTYTFRSEGKAWLYGINLNYTF